MERGGTLFAAAMAALALAACAQSRTTDSLAECGDPGGDVDAAADAPPAVCGDGVVAGDEACDGGSVACGDLAGSFDVGATAACRADCSGWDVSACSVITGVQFEVVKPGEREARWATARCNDGTPFGAMVRLNPASSAWIIDLEGGVMCDDDAISCAQRAIDSHELTTTLPDADRHVGPGPNRGVLSRNPAVNGVFAGANHVLAHYCSSDYWSGATVARRPIVGDATGWYFSGRTNVAALIGVLKERYGLDDSRADLKVLFMGNSAGAQGAHLNVRTVATLLPGATAAGRLALFLDAGWIFEWDQPAYRIINTIVSDREVARAAFAMWGGALDPECQAAAADPIDCWFGVGWWPHLRALVPTLVQESRRDSNFGGILHGPALDYALWQTTAEASMVGVDRLWSGATSYHTLSGFDAGWNAGPPGDTLREAVARFFVLGATERILW